MYGHNRKERTGRPEEDSLDRTNRKVLSVQVSPDSAQRTDCMTTRIGQLEQYSGGWSAMTGQPGQNNNQDRRGRTTGPGQLGRDSPDNQIKTTRKGHDSRSREQGQATLGRSA